MKAVDFPNHHLEFLIKTYGNDRNWVKEEIIARYQQTVKAWIKEVEAKKTVLEVWTNLKEKIIKTIQKAVNQTKLNLIKSKLSQWTELLQKHE